MTSVDEQVKQPEWLKLVDAAIFLGVYPGTLYRRYRYRQLPDGACKMVENTLFFNMHVLESMRGSKA